MAQGPEQVERDIPGLIVATVVLFGAGIFALAALWLAGYVALDLCLVDQCSDRAVPGRVAGGIALAVVSWLLMALSIAALGYMTGLSRTRCLAGSIVVLSLVVGIVAATESSNWRLPALVVPLVAFFRFGLAARPEPASFTRWFREWMNLDNAA